MKVLLAGCGGIGVEVLAALRYVPALKDLTLVDLDIVEVSNLSRQYIFQPADVGRAKAEAAGRWFQAERPDVTLR